MRKRSTALLFAVVLGTVGCSSYAVTSDPVRPIVPRLVRQPLRVAVAVPDIADPSLAGLGDVVTSVVQELYRDFISGLEQSALFEKVEQVPFSATRDPAPGSADLLATVLHRPEIRGAGERWWQEVLVLFSLFKLAPILQAHETFTITAELSIVRPTAPASARRYVGAGTARLASKIMAPREQALRDALIAAGRIANAKVLEQIARDHFARHAASAEVVGVETTN